MPKETPAIPRNIVKQFFPDGIPAGANTEELHDLFNPSIVARPLHMPESTRIRVTKNKEMHYYWVRDICGSNPNHARAENFRSNGWEYATTDDVEMMNRDTEKQKNEIRTGDLILMKIPVMRWREIRKAQLTTALSMTDPRRSPAVAMGLGNMDPTLNTRFVGDNNEMPSAVVSDAAEELRTGERKGNASVARIPKEK